MTDVLKLQRLIDFQQGWIDQLTEQQAQLVKYRDGILPINERQIALIASAQADLSKAVRNIANVIHASLQP